MVDDLSLLKKNLHESYSQQDELDVRFASALMRALNKNLLFILNNNQQQDMKNRKEQMITNIENFLQFMMSLEKSALISKLDIFNTFTDLFECASEDTLHPLFTLMEKSVFNGILINAETKGGDAKQDAQTMAAILNMISRICKTIMRKLSLTHDTGFRGKIQKLIASVFPLTHPSGLNRLGNFNTKNQTIFETLEEVKEEIESAKQGSISDYKLYKNFWNLQKYLTNPFNIFSAGKLEFEEIYDYSNGHEEGNNGDAMEAIELMEQNSEHKQDTVEVDGNSANGDEEEGQAENINEKEGSLSIDDRSSILGGTKVTATGSESNLWQVLSTIRDFVNKFMSQPLQVDKDNAQILQKYPKYLSKYSLLNLQFQDYLFRETFLTQVLIFIQTIQNPINPHQKKVFNVTEDEKKLITSVEGKVSQLLHDSIESYPNKNERSSILGKRKSMNECVTNIISREHAWSKWKENKCQNFEKPASQQVKDKKRDQKRSHKLISNPIFIQATQRDLNYAKNGMNMKKYLKQPKESIDTEGNSVNLKHSDLPNIADYLNPILMDVDPEQGIEDTYKHKHNQVFSWRFLREVSFVDLVNFHGKPEVHSKFHRFEGNVEEQSLILFNKNKKKEIDFNYGKELEENGDQAMTEPHETTQIVEAPQTATQNGEAAHKVETQQQQ